MRLNNLEQDTYDADRLEESEEFTPVVAPVVAPAATPAADAPKPTDAMLRGKEMSQTQFSGMEPVYQSSEMATRGDPGILLGYKFGMSQIQDPGMFASYSSPTYEERGRGGANVLVDPGGKFLGYRYLPEKGIIERPKPASILAEEQRLGKQFETIYHQDIISRGREGAQSSEPYGPPIGYFYDNGQSQYVNFDASGTYQNTVDRKGDFDNLLPLVAIMAAAYFGPAAFEFLGLTGTGAGAGTAAAAGSTAGAFLPIGTTSMVLSAPTTLSAWVASPFLATGSTISAVTGIAMTPEIAALLGQVVIETASNGGDAGLALKNAATSYGINFAAGQINNAISSVVNQAPSNVLSDSAKNAVTTGLTNAAIAAATGQNALSALAAAGASYIAPNLLKQIPGYGDMPAELKRIGSAAIQASLLGKNPTEAALNTALQLGKQAITSYIDTTTGLSQKIKDLRTGVENSLTTGVKDLTKLATDSTNTSAAIAAGFPDYATQQEYGGNLENFTADQNTAKATAAGFPNYTFYQQYDGNVTNYNNDVASAAATDKAAADNFNKLPVSVISNKDGEAVKFTDAQLTEMVRKSLIFDGGDYNTKQDAANAARLAGYTQFDYDTSVYTMQPGGPTEKDLFQSVINDAPNKKEAFRLARSLLGANQIFEYKGNKITTETLEEKNARQYNSDAAIQARVDLIPASGGSINTRTGTPANVSNTFIDQKTNQVVEDTRVWDAAGNVVSGILSVADQSKVLQVAGSLVLDAGTQMAEAFTGVGKFLGLIDKDSALAQNVNKLVSFNEAQKPPEVKAESAIFWNDVKNAQGIANTASVVLSSVVDKPLMTGFNIASEVIQTLGTLGAGAGVKYASTLLKAAPSIAAKLGIGTDAVLNIGESAGAAYNESYKKALSSVGAQVRDGSMTAADAEAYAEDTAGKTFFAAAGITGAVTLLPGGNALAKQILGSSAENAAMKTTFKEAIKSDAAKVGYKFAAGTTIKETISEGGEASLIEAASQKILSPNADYNWKDIVVTSMLESIYGGGHSAVIASADVAVSNFKDRLIASGVDQTEVESLTKKVADLVKSGDVSDASIAALKTETENLFENVGLRIDPTLDLMSNQFLSGVISQEVAEELSASGLSATQIAENLPNAISHIESGSKIDSAYVDQFLTDSGEARQIAQNLGYVNPSQEVLNSLTGPISEADAQAKLSDFLQSMSAFEAGKPISAADAQEMVKDLGLTTMSDTDAISLATKIVQSVPTDKLAPDPNIQLASDAGFPDVATYTQYGGDKAAYDKVQTDNANAQIATAAGFPDFASYAQYGGNANAYKAARRDAANLLTAKEAGFPDFSSYTQFNGNLTAYDKANNDAANIRRATDAGFPDYATFLQYEGRIADYSTAKAAETNRLTATNAGFPNYATYTQYNGDKAAYDAALSTAANTKTATDAGFPDFSAYTQYAGNKTAYDAAQADAANLQKATTAGFPDYASYTQYGGNKAVYDAALSDAANTKLATTAGFPDFNTYTQYGGDKKAYDTALTDAANTQKATSAGFPSYADYAKYGGDVGAYNSALTTAANIKKATDAGFPDYAAYTQYGGDIKAYNTANTNAANLQTATAAGFPDFASYTKFNGDIKAYNTAQTDATNLATAKAAGFSDYENYNLYKGDINAFNTANKNAENLTTAKAAGFPDYVTYTQYKGDVGVYNNELATAANVKKATDAGFPNYESYTQYGGDANAYKADSAAKIAGWKDAAEQTKASTAGYTDPSTYATYLTNTANTQKATTAGFPDYGTYTQFNGDLAAYNSSKLTAATTTAINNAISGIQFPAGITAADVAAQVKAALDANPNLKASDVTNAITTYMTANPGVTAADVTKAVDTATKNLVTTQSMTTALAGVTADVKTKFDGLTQGQKDIVSAQVQQGVDLNNAINSASQLTAQQITDVKTEIGTLTGDVKTKFDALTQGQKDIVSAQVQQGVDLNQAIETAAQTTTEQIANVKTDLTTNITNVQTQFNTRVDELVLQGRTYQEATQEALTELGTGIVDLQSGVIDIKEKAKQAAKVQTAKNTQSKVNSGLSNAMSLIGGAALGSELVDNSTPGFKDIGYKNIGDAKFESILSPFQQMVEKNVYAPKLQQQNEPQTQQPQQVAPVNQDLNPQKDEQEGSDYFSYGSSNEIDQMLGSNPGTQMLYSKAGGLATPLMAGGGSTRYGRYAGGGLPVIEHSGKARLDFRTGNAVTGPGDGQSDDIPAMLADGEFVFPADVVAALGNGSTKAGSDKLYDMMHSIRAYHRSAKPKDLPPPAKKSPLDYLKKTARKARR